MDSSCLWAKLSPFQSVRTHGIVSGIVAQAVYRKVLTEGNQKFLQTRLRLDEEQLVRFLCYLVSVHDIGKIECTFQSGDEEMKQRIIAEGLAERFISKDGIRHEQTSGEALRRIWEKQGMGRKTRKFYANIAKAHHQGKSGNGRKNSSPPWQQLQDSFEAEMRCFFWEENGQLPIFDVEDKSCIAALLLGILILSDWIASGEDFSDAETVLQQVDGIQVIQNRAEAFFSDNGFIAEPISWDNQFCGIWQNIPSEGRRPLQVEIENLFIESEKRIQMLLIEAPMGEGKTEAGMYAALQMQKQWGKNGFYIALPTSATSNQMVGRMRNLLSMHDLEDTVRLLHAMAWLVDEKTPEKLGNAGEEEQEIRNWLSPMRRGLLSPYAVGTVDQVMLAVSMAKYSVLRLLGISNKVLIIDEVHSYDVYMGEFIKTLLQWCRALNIPVVMLSATLPPEKRKELFAVYDCTLPQGTYPSISAVTEDGQGIVRRIPVSDRRFDFEVNCASGLNSPEKIAKMAMETVKDGGCICVLMNTVKEAQAVYAQLRKDADCHVLLFHARFLAERREEIEKECLRLYGKDKGNRPEKSILVATQVVEQSLDVDFDALITAIAPIDLVLQRMGRVHRHGNTQRPANLQAPKVWVLTPEDDGRYGASGVVYPQSLLQQTEHLLQNRRNIRIPEDMETLVADGYDMAKVPVGEMEKWFDMLAENAIKASQSKTYLLNSPDKEFLPTYKDPIFKDDHDIYLSVKTRLGEPTVRLALLEPELYSRVSAQMILKDGKKNAPVTNRKLAQEVLKSSVSVSIRQFHGNESVLLDTKGDKLLAGISILPTENGVCQCGQYEIVNDPHLGVLIREQKSEA